MCTEGTYCGSTATREFEKSATVETIPFQLEMKTFLSGFQTRNNVMQQFRR